ncbi:MAG: cysteine synthase CysM [Longimicrobiales bacterium]|nr:cysteine synthase CysM [Longimicrobiales bacterium]
MKFDDLIGNTPLVEFDRIPPAEGIDPAVRMLGKLEGHGPGGSVKDRAAWGMLSGLLERGEISDEARFVEATSGNTGIALAMVAARLGLRMTLIVPRSATPERVEAMRAYGAEVIRPDEGQDMEDARRIAGRMAATGEYRTLNQFANPDNWRMHYRTTGPEIWRDTEGQITHFVSAMGTTGTIMGASRYLKERDSAIEIVGAHPTEGSKISGIREWSPEMTPPIYEPARVDRIERVSESEARVMVQRMAREEGILAGMSSGGVLTAALRVARELTEGVVVFVVCDRGDRYLSSDLYDAEAARRAPGGPEADHPQISKNSI